jgi:diguanylate cyclase (GGDEF)-like protein
VHDKEVFRDASRNFRRSVGKNVIGRVFYTEPLGIVTKESPAEDYREMFLENEYAAVAVVRIGYGGRSLGFLAVYFHNPPEFDNHVKNFLLALAGAMSAALEKEEMVRLLGQLRRYDLESGLYCHTFFMTKLGEELEKARRHHHPLALAIIDVDNYKELVNLHGAPTAQQMFKELAEDLKGHLRGIDTVGLFGVDQFILSLPDTPLDQAEGVIRRFKEMIEAKTFTGKNVQTSFSCGMTSLKHEDSLDSLLWRAQMALHHARKQFKGAIQVVV